MAELTPFVLKDAPALIEAVFPAQKVSAEAQRERKAGPAQTLPSIGSYWKGRKPLILVRAIVLGGLLPQTDDREKDLEIFEQLMAFDQHSLAKRALIQNSIKPRDFALSIDLNSPWDYFLHNIKADDERFLEVAAMKFPFNPDSGGIKLRWRRDISEGEKLSLIEEYFRTIDDYEAKSLLTKRPEEVDQSWLYEHIWPSVNSHYAHLGVNASSIEQLTEQLGILRYGKRPRIGDAFSGGGSIPFEAARLGCDVNASDLNPIACMLTWGAVNIVGQTLEKRIQIAQEQRIIMDAFDKKITDLGVEHDKHGNRAKAYLYCLEVKCPETGWLVPISPSWAISKMRNIVAKLKPNHELKRFDIEVVSGVSKEEMKDAEKGTVKDGYLVYELDGKSYRTSIKTIRGDFADESGKTTNRLRKWNKRDFQPLENDIFQERLYAVQWITRETLGKSREETFFATVTEADLERDQLVAKLVAENIEQWQTDGLVPDMPIESGDKTDEPIRTRGWTHWHHLYNARQILFFALLGELSDKPETAIGLANCLDFNSKLCGWGTSTKWDGGPVHVFTNQALNTQYNYGQYSNYILTENIFFKTFPEKERSFPNKTAIDIQTCSAVNINRTSDLWITDPPYADAVNYHEITEYFIAWLRKNHPEKFSDWIWDSRRALAVKGSGDDFRKGMVDSYSAMATNMPDNGMQCVMFTHQDTGVWSDMIGIFWAAGLQVVGAWYIATETSSELKKGGYVQGTVILMLRKRPAGENAGFKQRLLPAVRAEVKNQIETMMHLNDEVKDKMGEPVFNDSDLQMAGYAAALKVLTSYTHIGGEDVTTFALRPRTKGEITVVDEIVQQAAEAANSLLVPEGLSTDTWQKLSGIQRFYLRMMDIETTGAAKLDNYQNFAKAFRVEDYSRVMGSMAANKAQLKRIPEFASRDLTESNEIGSTWLGHLIIGLQQLLAETDPQAVISQLQADLPDFMEIRALLIDVLTFIENKAPEKETRDVAEVLGARLKNMRALGN
jgi:adenine-specific DNA methylase